MFVDISWMNKIDIAQAYAWLMYMYRYFESVLCVPKTWICPFLYGFIQQKLQIVYILKTK